MKSKLNICNDHSYSEIPIAPIAPIAIGGRGDGMFHLCKSLIRVIRLN